MLRKTDTTRRTLNIGGAVCLAIALYALYHVLVKDKLLPVWIASFLSSSGRFFNHWHILAVGLVPVSLGLMIFGAAVLSIHGGSALQRWLARAWRKKQV